MKKVLVVLFLVSGKFSVGQQFQNLDLEGTYTGISQAPPQWQQVPFTDPISIATNRLKYATSDLTDPSGPAPASGVMGNPYSGNTFVSAQRSMVGNGSEKWHEGIMQTVSGFTPGKEYTLSFYQAVVKQSIGLDRTGAWAVYLDNTQVAISAVSTSNRPWDSVNLIWELRTVKFTPTATTHTVKFMVWDDDADYTFSSTNTSGALRMGIDNVQIEQECELNTGFDNDQEFICPNESAFFDVTADQASYTWNDGYTGSTRDISQSGTYWVTVTNSCGTVNDTVTVVKSDFNLNIRDSVSTGCDRFSGGRGIGIADASGGTLPYTYLWNTTPARDTRIVEGLTEGDYEVTVTDAKGCSMKKSITIDPYLELELTTLEPSCSQCNDGTATVNVLNGGVPPYTYRWVPGDQTAATATGLSNGIYEVFVTDSEGCFDKKTVTVGSVGIEISTKHELKISPNPTTGIFKIEADQIEVFDLSGRHILNTQKHLIDISAYPKGMYVVRAYQGKQVYYSKVVLE